ncbi:NUDIX hydrolase [Candidatus Borrarchaeum sp.]|uniref:NUDIX hydrolase n=1 Tax=Candidatus Borrarchaeum sp. TaxID=2846742 RepID=UPI003183F45E
MERIYIKRNYPTRPLVGVGAIVLDGEKVLMVKRGNEPGRGKWSFPGGLVNVGEAVREAAKREVKEETGLSVKIGDLAGVIDVVIKDDNRKVQYHYVIIDFFATRESGEISPRSDAEDVRWVLLKDLFSLDVTKTAINLLRQLNLLS